MKAYWEAFPSGHPAIIEGDSDEEGKEGYLMACTDKSNVASRKVLMKNGFWIYKEGVKESGREMLDWWRFERPGKDGDHSTP